MPKMFHFGEFLKTWSLRSNSVTRQVSFNRTKIGGKCQNAKNSNATFWMIFKQCEQVNTYILWLVVLQMRLFKWFSNSVWFHIWINSRVRGTFENCFRTYEKQKMSKQQNNIQGENVKERKNAWMEFLTWLTVFENHQKCLIFWTISWNCKCRQTVEISKNVTNSWNCKEK